MLPFNIASYALLAHIIGKMTNMTPLGIEGDLSNVHIYEPHMDAVKEQLSRTTNMHNSKTELIIDENIKLNLKNIDNKTVEIKHFNLTPYSSQPAIKAEMFSRNK